MAEKKIRIGSLPDIILYDDGDYSEAIDTDGVPINIGSAINSDHAVRLDQIPTPGTGTSSDAVIADNAIVRGDGGARKLQSSAFYINDAGDLYNTRVMLTIEGGIAIKLTNNTGSATVKGMLVSADTADDDAVVLTAISDIECFGVFYENGIADGVDTWVVVSGIADVLFEDNHGPAHGNWVETSNSEAGYAVSSASPAAAPAHFQEIGHCIETVAAEGAGTHVAARCVLHFN